MPAEMQQQLDAVESALTADLEKAELKQCCCKGEMCNANGKGNGKENAGKNGKGNEKGGDNKGSKTGEESKVDKESAAAGKVASPLLVALLVFVAAAGHFAASSHK